MKTGNFTFSGSVQSPCYVFDSSAFSARAEQVARAFGEETKLCFSIKANPFLLACLPDVFDKIEVCSPGELTICEKMGVDMRRVIFSGVNKSREDVERAMDDGVGIFTAESMQHLAYIHEAAGRRGVVVPLLLRLTAGSQFGMDGDVVRDIVARRTEYPSVRIEGIHYFSGTQKKKPAIIARELEKVTAFMDDVEATLGFRFEKLEYGAGLSVDYFTPDAPALEDERLAGVSDAIRAAAKRYALTVEMGRFFAAPCGMYVTTVVDVKTNEGVNYAIVDGGMHQIRYDGQIQGMQTPQIVHLQEKEQEERPWTICGSLCTTADVLARNVPLRGLAVGDTLVFMRAGAYSCMEGMSIFLSRDLPSVYLLDREGELRLLRDKLLTDPFNTPKT